MWSLSPGCKAAALLAVGLTANTVAAAPSAADKRRELLDKVGLTPRDPEPPADDPPTDDPPRSADEPSEDADPVHPVEGPPTPDSPPSESTAGASRSAAPRVTYTGRIHRWMQSGCASCHKAGGAAGGTKFRLTGDPNADVSAARSFTRRADPAASPLLTKGAGQAHGGGAPFPVGSRPYEDVLAWIRAGTPRGSGPADASSPEPAPPPTVADPAAAATEVAGTTPSGRSPSRAPAASPTPTPVPESTEPLASTASTEPETTVGSTPIPYAPEVHQVLVDKCAACHVEGGLAGKGGFVLTRDPRIDLERTIAVVNREDPTASALLTKGSGQAHGGGSPMPTDSDAYRLVLSWIESQVSAAPILGTVAGELEVDAMSGATPPPESRLGDGAALPPVPEGASSNLPFSLPFHLYLNGRFDFSYERRNYKGHPFQTQGQDAFATYHHFLFLSRSGAKDPFGFNVELITQQFYEFNGRFSTKNHKAHFLVKAGKILVPFGDEPLFHTSYGGRTGFDQELLPVVWAVPGIAFNVNGRLGPVTLGNDIYVVQGHRMRSEDAVLNLQSDFSALDDLNVGFGDRIGLSVLPFTAWYSFQVTPMEFDRVLFMQALDLEFWRLRGVPVLADLVLAVGAMRADVSGAGSGQDYYHFGSYMTVRYYPTVDFVYIQYRAGLKTFDNRRGIYFDDTRMDERDRGSHNITVMARYRGFYGGVQFFWNLEKANEQDDDFLRITLGYEF